MTVGTMTTPCPACRTPLTVDLLSSGPEMAGGKMVVTVSARLATPHLCPNPPGSEGEPIPGAVAA